MDMNEHLTYYVLTDVLIRLPKINTLAYVLCFGRRQNNNNNTYDDCIKRNEKHCSFSDHEFSRNST